MFLDRVLRRIASAGFQRTLAGEDWAWLWLAAAALVIRHARRDDPAQVLKLRRGETLIIGPADRDGSSAR